MEKTRKKSKSLWHKKFKLYATTTFSPTFYDNIYKIYKKILLLIRYEVFL